MYLVNIFVERPGCSLVGNAVMDRYDEICGIKDVAIDWQDHKTGAFRSIPFGDPMWIVAHEILERLGKVDIV